MAFFHAAVRDPRRARDPGSPFLPGAVDVERGLQQPPLQLAPLLPDHLLPLPVIAEPGLVRRPGRQPGELLRRGGERRRQLPVQRGLAPVLPDLPHRHRGPTVTAAPPDACRERLPPSIPETDPEPAEPATERHPGRVPGAPPPSR